MKPEKMYGKGKDLDGWGRDLARQRYEDNEGDTEKSKKNKDLLKERTK